MGRISPASIVLIPLLALVAVVVSPSRVAGQAALPPEIVRAGSLQAEQERQVERFVTEWLSALETGDSGQKSRARRNLQEPLRDAQASVEFRIRYSGLLLPGLNRLVSGEDEEAAIHGILLAGELATEDALAFLRAQRAGDKASATRYAAVVASRSTFLVLRTGSLAMRPEAAHDLMDRLASELEQETDPEILDAYVRAMVAGIHLGAQARNPVLARLRDRGLESLVTAVGARVRQTDGEADPAVILPCLRATEFVRNMVVEDAPRRRLSEAIVRESGGLGGDLLAYVYRALRSPRFPAIQPEDNGDEQADKRRKREPLVMAASLGESLALVAKDWLEAGGPAESFRFAQLVEPATPGQDRELLAVPRDEASRSLLQVIGEGRLLTRPPFNFPADRFLR